MQLTYREQWNDERLKFTDLEGKAKTYSLYYVKLAPVTSGPGGGNHATSLS